MAASPGLHSRCVQLTIGSISDAVSIFSSRNERGEVPLVLIPEHRSPFAGTGWWLTIPTGCFCLMQRFGRDIGIAAPGGSLKPPYYRIAYVVTSQSCNYNAPVKECPTADNVRVGVDVHIVFNIQNPSDFVYKLGAVHFDQLLSGAVDEGIRVLVRAQSHQTVRMLRGNRAEQLLSLLNRKFDSAGVKFHNCTITHVELPAQLESSLERTTELKKAMARTTREHQFRMGEIQQKCNMDLEELNRKSEQTIVGEQGRKKQAELKLEQRLVKEEELSATAMIEAEQQAMVRQMEATALLDRTRVQMEQSRVETISRAEADAEAKRVSADIEFEKALLSATAEKERLLGDAEAIRLDAQAEADSHQHLEHKRRHELDMREKEVLVQLAGKMGYNLIGDPGDLLVDAMMTGHLKLEPK